MADMKRNIDKVEELAENWIKKAANPEIAARRMINKHPESLKDVSALLIAETGKRILDQIRGEFEQFIEVEERLTAERQANAADSFLTTRDVTITIMITSLVFGGLIAMFITRAITKPVHKLVDALASVGAGDLTTEVKIKSRDEIGELAVSFNQMVGDLKESNCALRESEERFRSLVENTTDWIWEVNEHARYTYVSPQVSKILSYEPDEVVGMTPFDLMTSEDQQRLRKQFVEIAARQEPFSRLENANLHKDGHSVVILETSGVPIFGTDGLFKGYRGIDRDITERKKMEEILLESEKLKSLGIITAGIAHEFNNILAVMVGSAELLEGGFKNEKELKKVLRSIITAGDDGAEIVRNMLKFAKSEGKDTADYIFFDISYLINEAIDFAAPRWRNMAQAEGIDYKIDREGMREIPEARCNTTELREVFTNIINNALDAMPDGGTLSFSTWSDDGSVFVSITDTGKGMSEGVKKKIFDPFFTTRRPLGTGLGMSVSYGVIMRHGGRIEVESEVGKGTTFTLSIPIGKDVLQKTVPPEPVRQISAKKLHILVVDDSDEMCVIMDNFITKAGHNIKTIDNGADAIELAGKEDFDLILCDLAMPNVYGYDVISAINKSDKRQKIGIMTGWEEKLKPVDDEEFKVDFVIKKPFKHSELAKHINELFGADCKK